MAIAGARNSPLLVTLGPVAEPHGGLETRARFTAEVFADRLGVPMVVLSTDEPALAAVPLWAVALQAPTRARGKVFSLEMIRLIRAAAVDRSFVVMSHATFLPAFAAARMRLPIIWDTNECHSLHYRRLPPTATNRLKYLGWLALERWAARRCDVVVAIGEIEAATWQSTHPKLAPKLVVVDHAPLARPRDPEASRIALRSQLERDLDGPLLLFLGTMRAKQNVSAVHWILDTLADRLPAEATVLLCGPGTGEFQKTGSGGAAVIGLGAVDDVDTVIAAADLCLAPLAAGAGVKTKVLHYLAHGKRVVGTPIAFEGLADAPGLFEAPLERLPDVVLQVCREVESAAAAKGRIRSVEDWLDGHHGRAHVAQQWKQALDRLTT